MLQSKGQHKRFREKESSSVEVVKKKQEEEKDYHWQSHSWYVCVDLFEPQLCLCRNEMKKIIDQKKEWNKVI